MSEAKNTALAGSARFGYSHVSPARHQPPIAQTSALMITATLILSALVLLTATDDPGTRSGQ
jgi:hypothetical protein